jgi:hypothetical protein
VQEFVRAVEPPPGSPRSPLSPSSGLMRPPLPAGGPVSRPANSGLDAGNHPSSTVEPVALASSLMMLVSIDEPRSAQATFANMLFKSVDIRPFVLVVDYHPVKVGPCSVS